MKIIRPSLFFAALLASPSGVSAVTLLYTDNFNIPDTSSLDGSDQTGRHAGLLATNVVLRSGGIQQTISGGQLNILNAGAGRVRFQDAGPLPANQLWNFAAGAAGAQILADGGFRVEFDWTAPNNTSDDWLSFNMGFNYLDTAVGVNNASTDFGILFRNNGGTQIFDNGSVVGSPSFNASAVAAHHATMDFTMGSFADGTNVAARIYVDNVAVGLPVNFNWDANSGSINMELSSLSLTKQLDNVSISTVPEPSGVVLSAAAFLAAAVRGRRRTA